LKRSRLPLRNPNQFGEAVYRVRLNRTQQNDLNSRFFHSDEKLVEKWSSDLPGLTKLEWDQLDKTMFQHLVNLEELNFPDIDSRIAKIDSNTFAFNKNLRKLTITHTVLTLNSQSFNGLVNLTELELIRCEIDALPDGLFDSCASLKVVDLSKNKFIKFETSTFQNLVNLEELDLSLNSIKELDSNLFRCNKKLIKLGLYNNKISKLNKDFFRGLCQLTHLHLAYNEIVSLPEAPFDNCLKVVNLSRNKLINLGTSTFQTWVNLEELDFSFNPIERVDYSNILACNKNLRKLNISGISSKSLNNQSFYGLNLTELDLQSCQIMDLTEKLFNSLLNLTRLDLSNNEIMSLPDGVFHNLTNLKYLNLSHIQISELPNNVFDSLINLENSHLGGNKLTNIPKGLFDNLISLTFLNLHSNKIEFQEDSDPNIFKGLKKLTNLYLDNNQISILPEGIFKNLVSLEGLNLAYNQIMSFPKEFFKDLVSLKRLWLEGNVMEIEDGDFLYIDMKNLRPIPKHIKIYLKDYGDYDSDDSDDEDSTDEMINEQNDSEAYAE